MSTGFERSAFTLKEGDSDDRETADELVGVTAGFEGDTSGDDDAGDDDPWLSSGG